MSTPPVFSRYIPAQYILLAAIIIFMPSCALAQSSAGQLGDATVTPIAPSQVEPYGINSAVENASSPTFFTRHNREGNEGGIGSSYLGTTSITAESQPISRYSSHIQITTPAVPVPNTFRTPRLFSETMLSSPALSPTLYPKPTPALTGLNISHSEPAKIEPYNVFWGHQKPWGSFQPTTDSFRGFELLSK